MCPSHPCLTGRFNSSRFGSTCAVWQTQDEINELKEDIFRLERDVQSKMAPLKLVQTRLEYRTRRPGMDLCRDKVNVHVNVERWSLFPSICLTFAVLWFTLMHSSQVQYGLVEETKQLSSSILALKQKLAQAQWVDVLSYLLFLINFGIKLSNS